MKTIDLKKLRDDKTVLTNPHKGWYWHYMDNSMKSVLYRNLPGEDDAARQFPGLRIIYLRVDWADIEVDDGVFDWSGIDEVMDAWQGWSFTFRFCSSEPCREIPFATPEWLYKKGCPGKFFPPSLEEDSAWYEPLDKENGWYIHRNDPKFHHCYWEPDYGSEMFLTHLERFVKEAAAHLDNDPRVEHIDLGSYGNWGEGHTYFTARKCYGVDALKAHAKIYAKYFRNKPVMLNDDYINQMVDATDEEKREVLDCCIGLGMGIRDDSIITGEFRIRDYHTIMTPEMFDEIYPHAPVDLELEHYRAIKKEDYKDNLVFLEAMKRGHATYAGFHGYPSEFYRDNPYFAEYAANRLGYWFFVNDITINDEILAGAKQLLWITFENGGFGLCYHRYALDVRLKNETSEVIIEAEGFDSRAVKDISRQTLSINVPENLAEGQYKLSVRMRENDTVIRLGIKNHKEDGFYELCEVLVEGL